MNVFIAIIHGAVAELTPAESWHCTKVLRYKTGENIDLIDGKGNFYKGILKEIDEKRCVASITSGPRSQQPQNYFLHLAIAPTKSIDRTEWFIEKAVEIGIHEITFVRCKNSERTVIKTDRLQKIAESAVKQSLQAFIPKINELTNLEKILDSDSDNKLMAHCFEEDKLVLKNIQLKNKSSLVLVGPEGDFTREEVELARKKNFTAINLGENRLRTETAGLYVCNAFTLLT
jgi:16S rRNA (uracil1498-N3)-methyltransferase